MIKMKKETKGIIQIIFAGILLSFFPIFVRLITHLDAYSVTFFRILIPVILLSLFFVFFKNKLSPLKYEKKKMLLFGGLHGFIILGYFIAIKYLTIASAVLLMYTFPIWTMIFSYFLLKEKITRKSFFALMSAFIGIIILLSPENFFIKKNLIGSIVGLFAGVGAGLVYTLSKTFKKYDKISLTYWQNVIALPFILPLLFIDFPNFNLVTLREVIFIFIIGINSIIPFILVYKGISKVGAHKSTIIMLLEILYPIILAFIIFEETPPITTYLGGLLIVLGAYLATR